MARNRFGRRSKTVVADKDEDLGNIFTTMLGVCTLLEERDPRDPDVTRYIRLLRSSVERAVSLVGRRRHD